jgi:hypothetical protein
MGSGVHIASATAQRNRVRRAHNSGVTPAGKDGDAALEESAPLLLPVAAPLRPSCALGRHTNREDGEGRRWREWRESSLPIHLPPRKFTMPIIAHTPVLDSLGCQCLHGLSQQACR